jgi:FolB domain-containing protein
MDCIHIRDLDIECIVGVLPEERHKPRTVRVNLRIGCDVASAGQSDCLADTVDYREVRDRVVAAVRESRDGLVERLAQRVADAALAVRGVSSVTVVLDKPGALEGARSVAVEITRARRPGAAPAADA